MYPAPLVRAGSKLRLALPGERQPAPARPARRPTGTGSTACCMAYRDGDVPVARAYLDQHAVGRRDQVLDLVAVWIEEADDEALQREAEALRFGL